MEYQEINIMNIFNNKMREKSLKEEIGCWEEARIEDSNNFFEINNLFEID